MKSLLPKLFAIVLLASAGAAQVPLSTYALHSPGPHAGHGSRHGYASSRVWIPGGYETVCERVWVPGRIERLWVEPSFGLAYDSCGRRVRVLLRAGHWQEVRHPGRYETRSVRVYRPGHWVARGSAR